MKKNWSGVETRCGRKKSRQKVWYKTTLLCLSCRIWGVKTLATSLLPQVMQETTAAVTRSWNLHYQRVISYVLPIAAFATRIKMVSSNQHLFYYSVISRNHSTKAINSTTNKLHKFSKIKFSEFFCGFDFCSQRFQNPNLYISYTMCVLDG